MFDIKIPHNSVTIMQEKKRLLIKQTWPLLTAETLQAQLFAVTLSYIITTSNMTYIVLRHTGAANVHVFIPNIVLDD